MGKAIPYFPTVPEMASYRVTFTFTGSNNEHILCYTVQQVKKQHFPLYTAYYTELMNFYQHAFNSGIPT